MSKIAKTLGKQVLTVFKNQGEQLVSNELSSLKQQAIQTGENMAKEAITQKLSSVAGNKSTSPLSQNNSVSNTLENKGIARAKDAISQELKSVTGNNPIITSLLPKLDSNKNKTINKGLKKIAKSIELGPLGKAKETIHVLIKYLFGEGVSFNKLNNLHKINENDMSENIDTIIEDIINELTQPILNDIDNSIEDIINELTQTVLDDPEIIKNIKFHNTIKNTN
jgi:hypothetical protein